MSSQHIKLKQLKPFNPKELPHPSLDVQKNLETFIQDAEEGSLDFEIGCGVGLHPIQYAGQNPKRYLIAVEHTLEKFKKFSRRFESHPKLKNLLPVHANAISVAHHLIAKASIERCFILYPNPNPKNLNQRWHAMPFMGELLDLLTPTGELIMATNELFYAEEAIHWMTNYWGLEAEIMEVTQAQVNTHAPWTHFEKKYLLRGETCFHLTFKKK